MIEAGKCFCPKCGTISTDLFFQTGAKKTGAFLRRGLLLSRWTIEPFDPTSTTGTTEKIRMRRPLYNKQTGAIDTIEVEYEEAGKWKPEKLFRSCPNCQFSFPELAYDYGMYPVFVVGAVGDRNAGKSAWYGSISVNASAVNQAGYPYKLECINESESNEQDENTPENSLGNTKLLRIYNTRDNDRVVADVLLIDTSGEPYRHSIAENEFCWNILGSHEDYPGADAFVFLEPADKRTEYREQGGGSDQAEGIYRECKKRKLFVGKPVAYISSRVDILLEEKRFPVALDDTDTAKVPLLDQNTFFEHRSYRRDDIIARMAKEHSITCSMSAYALKDSDSIDSRGFMVQSCRDGKKPDGSPSRLYEYNMNVLDPLLWLLNRLGIFPLK